MKNKKNHKVVGIFQRVRPRSLTTPTATPAVTGAQRGEALWKNIKIMFIITI